MLSVCAVHCVHSCDLQWTHWGLKIIRRQSSHTTFYSRHLTTFYMPWNVRGRHSGIYRTSLHWLLLGGFLQFPSVNTIGHDDDDDDTPMVPRRWRHCWRAHGDDQQHRVAIIETAISFRDDENTHATTSNAVWHRYIIICICSKSSNAPTPTHPIAYVSGYHSSWYRAHILSPLPRLWFEICMRCKNRASRIWRISYIFARSPANRWMACLIGGDAPRERQRESEYEYVMIHMQRRTMFRISLYTCTEHICTYTYMYVALHYTSAASGRRSGRRHTEKCRFNRSGQQPTVSHNKRHTPRE